MVLRENAVMSQRDSGYERKERDLYETPEWVTLAIKPHLGNTQKVYEPAAGGGKMVSALSGMGLLVEADDISEGRDFLKCPYTDCDAIITNPPYILATEFIEHALRLTYPRGKVIMLLRTDFDHAKTRAHLFSGCAAFAKKIVLTKRIVWFEAAAGKSAAPSFNHAWYVWDWRNKHAPTLVYDIQV